MTGITLLGGSVGQEIVMRSSMPATPLWSTSVMMETPEIVGQVHSDYFDAGATVATTNTYAVHRDRLAPVHLESAFERLIETALEQAERAVNAHPQSAARIAGSLGPLGASYRPDICPPADQARGLYAELVRLMQDRVDFVIIETVASIEHAKGALLGAADTAKPVWLAVSVQDEDGTRLRSGEALQDLSEVIEKFAPDAVLVNCSRPEVVLSALEVVAQFGKPFGAYANGFTQISDAFLQDRPTVDALTARDDLAPDAYADFVMTWIEQGATIVGGCCEIGPAHIAEMARRIVASGYTVV